MTGRVRRAGAGPELGGAGGVAVAAGGAAAVLAGLALPCGVFAGGGGLGGLGCFGDLGPPFDGPALLAACLAVL